MASSTTRTRTLALQLCSHKVIAGMFERAVQQGESPAEHSDVPQLRLPDKIKALLAQADLRQIGDLVSEEYSRGGNLADSNTLPSDVTQTCADLVLKMTAQGDMPIHAVALALPLPVSIDGSKVLVPWLTQAGRLQRMQSALESKLTGSQAEHAKIIIRNRAHIGAWAEYRHRSRNMNMAMSLAYVDVGASIAFGLITDGKLGRGERGFAGLSGHVGYDEAPKVATGRDAHAEDAQRCEICRQPACDALLASGRLLTWNGRRLLRSGQGADITTAGAARTARELAMMDVGYVLRLTGRDRESNGSTPVITSLAVVDAAEVHGQGQSAAAAHPHDLHVENTSLTLVQQAGSALGRIVAQVLWNHEPGLVVLGGLALESNVLCETVKSTVDATVLDELICPIEWAELGALGPLYGAAVYASE